MRETQRTEYPRPQFERTEWMTLNGEWDFSFDQDDYDLKIQVPFAYQAKLSGIGKKEFHETVWYRRYFTIPESWNDHSIILQFGAVDYECEIWVNGIHAASHIGGQTSFSVDITSEIQSEKNELRVCVKDYHKKLDIPRGKQYWEEESRSIFYTATTGIWQSVWLEPVARKHIEQVLITPLLDDKSVKFEYSLQDAKDCILETTIEYENKVVVCTTLCTQTMTGSYTVALSEALLGYWNTIEDLTWSPEQPRLFDVTFRLSSEDKALDEVRSYFGLRKISIEDGTILLNNRPYYQRLILDQGYWPDGLLTAPSDEAFVEDIMLTKKMGFNGVRKHQKVEDPRYLYHADRLGLLVWGEIGAGYHYSRSLAESMMKEWTDTIIRDYNHPCIVTWTPLNESWGVMEIGQKTEQQNFCRALYTMTKALDSTRPISDNDGWEHVENDLLTIHDYESDPSVLWGRYSSLDQILKLRPAGKSLYVSGNEFHKEPIIVSEFGGISYQKEEIKGWGYSEAKDEQDFLKRYHDVVVPLLRSEKVQGFCYTQLTDIENETNGLLTYHRQPKADLDQIGRITCGGSLVENAKA